MTTCTPLGLVYPDGGDRPCDVAPVTCEFANGVEGYLDQLDDLVNRTATTVPMVWLRTQVPVTVTQSSVSLPVIKPVFDTVVVDTDNMADLTAMPSEITINRTGIYLFGIAVRGQVALPSGSPMNTFSAVSPTGATSFPSGGTGFNSYLPRFRSYLFITNYILGQTNAFIVPLSAGETYTMSINPSGVDGDSLTVNDVSMYAIWMGDVA